MKELVRHLWRSHKDEITAKSILNCHCRGVHSIMLIEKPEQTIRLYVADWPNDLYKNYSFRDEMSVAFHAHHCDLTIHVLKGELRNRVAKESEQGTILSKFIYHSKIKDDDIKFEKIGDVSVSVIKDLDLLPYQSVFMPADTIHTVASPIGIITAWFVYEGKEDPNYKPYCF